MCTLKDKLVECGACVAAVILVLAVWLWTKLDCNMWSY